MKKLIKNPSIVLMVLSASLLLNACKKTNPSETAACTTNKTTLAGSYKLTAMKYQATPTSEAVDYWPFVEACEKDDLLTLAANGTYFYKDLGVACDPNGTENGNWNLEGDVLTCSNSAVLNGKLISFDCRTLVYSVSDILAPADKTIVTLTKQ